MFPGIAKDFLVAFRQTAPCPFVESPQVSACGRDVQAGLVWQKGDLDKNILVYVYGDQAVFFFFNDADFGQVQGQQGVHIPVMGT